MEKTKKRLAARRNYLGTSVFYVGEEHMRSRSLPYEDEFKTDHVDHQLMQKHGFQSQKDLSFNGHSKTDSVDDLLSIDTETGIIPLRPSQVKRQEQRADKMPDSVPDLLRFCFQDFDEVPKGEPKAGSKKFHSLSMSSGQMSGDLNNNQSDVLQNGFHQNPECHQQFQKQQQGCQPPLLRFSSVPEEENFTQCFPLDYRLSSVQDSQNRKVNHRQSKGGHGRKSTFYIKSVDSDFVEVSEIQRRVQYVSTVKARTKRSIKKTKEFLSKIYPQLFEYALVVGLRPLSGNAGYKPYIIHKFPETVDSNVSVPVFCFPDANEYKPSSSSSSESYSFVLTNIDGERVYGYCRRIKPPDSSLHEVLCIISPVDALNMYNKLLDEIEKFRMTSIDLAQELIAASFGRPMPGPGKVVHIRTLDIQGEMETFFLNRPADSRRENVHYDSLLNYLGTDKLIKVFSSLMMERRVLLCSKSLSCLTQTLHALVALLYPFCWQHIYIPLLPPDMLDVCASPTPYLIGILKSHLPQVLQEEDMLEEVMIVDLDKKQFVRSLGDESTILPKKLQKALKTAINMCKLDRDLESSQCLMVAEAFMRMFIEIMGHFGEFIVTQSNGQKKFEKEKFVCCVNAKGIQQVLEWFSETQMFEVFITNQLEKREWGTIDLFMTRLMEYKREDFQDTRVGFGQKVKNIGKALKTKLS